MHKDDYQIQSLARFWLFSELEKVTWPRFASKTIATLSVIDVVQVQEFKPRLSETPRTERSSMVASRPPLRRDPLGQGSRRRHTLFEKLQIFSDANLQKSPIIIEFWNSVWTFFDSSKLKQKKKMVKYWKSYCAHCLKNWNFSLITFKKA